MTFEAAPAAGFAPHTITTFSTPNDPHDLLPPAAQKKWTAFLQRTTDAHNAIPEFAIRKEAAETVSQHQGRIADLKRLKSEGGNFGLSDDAATVIAERAKLERAIAFRDQQEVLYELRGGRWNIYALLQRSIHDWCLAGGIPANCTIAPVDDPPLSELLAKGENANGSLAPVVLRYDRQRRELAAALHRVRSAPITLKEATAKAVAQIDAGARAPDCDSVIEFGSALGFPMVTASSIVHNVDAPAITFVEHFDALGFLCWLLRDQIVGVTQELEVASDEAAAMSERDKQQAEATITSDMLDIERRICAVIWHAEARGEILDFPATTSPQSLLGLQLIHRPRTDVPGTTASHAYDIVRVGRR